MMHRTLNALEATSIPASAESLRGRLRAFLKEEVASMSVADRSRSWAGFDAEFSRRLGERGYLGLTFPVAYGGAGLDAFARYVVAEELLNAGAPVAAHWIADRQSGPLILRYGTEAQKQRYLPSIACGQSFWCIGMSEPNSGSDLASIRTRAVREGTGWRLNGQKIWTTHGHRSNFAIVLVRTSSGPEDRQKGLSQVIVDLSLPGVTTRPIVDLTGDAHFSEMFFDDVLLDSEALIGEEGNGWSQVTAELAFERSGPERFYTSMSLFTEWLGWLRAKGATDIEQQTAGRILAQLAPIRALSIAITGKLATGETPVIEAALVKDLGTAVEQEIPVAITRTLDSGGIADLPPALAAALDYTTLAAPSYSLRGGTRDILRGMIARGLGLR